MHKGIVHLLNIPIYYITQFESIFEYIFYYFETLDKHEHIVFLTSVLYSEITFFYT